AAGGRVSVPVSEAAALVRAVTDPQMPLDRDALEERFARARWSGIAEPGDAYAGRLLAAVGAARASALLAGSAAELERVADGSFADAVDRWRPRLRQLDTALHLRQAA